MEVPPCALNISNHAALLLADLNLQRERAQFCDCVLRQRQSPGQLYPAHRCVLAASSPVLASILSSAGVLVELQAPCLSDSVLAPLLDYVYTGALPSTHSQQQFSSLLTAACYLQMDELQGALRARQQTRVNDADASTRGENQKDINNTYWTTVNSDLPSTSSTDAIRRLKEKHLFSVESATSSHERTACQCSANRETSGETQMHSDATSLSNVGSCESRQHLTPKDLIQTYKSTAEVDKEVQKDDFHSAVIVKPEMRQKSTSSSSSSSSSSPRLCCEAVPVIRHSSRAAILQLAPYKPASEGSGSSSRAAVQQSANPDNDSSSTNKDKNQRGAQNQDYGPNNHTVTHSRDYEASSDQCAVQDLCCRSSTGDHDRLDQDHNINTGHLKVQNTKHMDSGPSHMTDHNDQHAHCDSFQRNTKRLMDDPVPQHNDRSEGSRCKTNLRPSKHTRLDCFEGHNVSVATAAEEHSQDVTAVVSIGDSDAGSHCEDLCVEGEVKEEHSYTTRCPAEMDIQNSRCGLKTHWCSNMCSSDTRTKDEHGSNNRHTAADNKGHGGDSCSPVSTAPESGLDNITGGLPPSEGCTENPEPRSTFTMVDTNMSDTKYRAVDRSYRGHIHYHCLPQEDLSHGGSDHSQPRHSDRSDGSSDEEEVGTFASPGCSPLKQHFATDTTNQVVLLDIGTKPAKLLVSYEHPEKGIREPLETGIRTQSYEATSVAVAEMKQIRAESLNETEIKTWVSQTNAEQPAGARVIHKAGSAEAVSSEGEDQCANASAPVCARASVSTTLSVCIPPTLSAGMPTDISAHLSAPVHHPFQCSLCDRSFSQRGSLNRHVRSHLGVRPFPCPRCPMTFSRQYRVTEHMRVHLRCAFGNDFQNTAASSTSDNEERPQS